MILSILAHGNQCRSMYTDSLVCIEGQWKCIEKVWLIDRCMSLRCAFHLQFCLIVSLPYRMGMSKYFSLGATALQLMLHCSLFLFDYGKSSLKECLSLSHFQLISLWWSFRTGDVMYLSRSALLRIQISIKITTCPIESCQIRV